MRAFAVFLALALSTSALAAESVSDADLLRMALAHSPGEFKNLPVGDGRYTLDDPRPGYVYLCGVPPKGGGANGPTPWIRNGVRIDAEKPHVEGDIHWPQAAFRASAVGSQREMSGNGLPTTHSTGAFPISPSDPAFVFDHNPNSITVQSLHENVDLAPAYSDTPHCMGMEVGVMLDGVPMLNAFDAEMRDAAAHEVLDRCEGHPHRGGTYHYHSLSPCTRDRSIRSVLGFALDGFPITGGEVAPGKPLMTSDLDECHGLTSRIVLDGREVTTFHYVMTPDFPYSASCFRGRPSHIGPAGRAQPVSAGSGASQIQDQERPPMPGPGQAGPAPDGRGPPPRGMRGPPPEALEACQGTGEGRACRFVAPRGETVEGECRRVPEGSIACVPARRP